VSNINDLTPKLLEVLEISEKLLDAIDSLRYDNHQIPWKIFNQLMMLEKATIIFNENIEKTEEILG